MLYRAAAFLVKWALKEFFCEIHVQGEKPVTEGPVIVVGNHPNMMFDAFIVGVTINRPLWFLGKSTLFEIPVLGSVLPALKVVPVYRQQDNPPTVSKNASVFEKVCERLGSGDAIALFPEGTSMGERRLYPIKTGASRIAFQTLSSYPDVEDIPLQPVGITYSHLSNFRSSVTVTIGPPISGRSYYSGDMEDRERVRALTEALSKALREVTVEVRDPEDAHLVDLIGSLYTTAGIGENDFTRLKLIAHHVNTARDTRTGEALPIVSDLENYCQKVRRTGLSDNEQLDSPLPSLPALVFSIPVLFGAITHAIPYRLTGPIALRLADDKMYVASYKLVCGLILFLLTYSLIAGIALFAGCDLATVILLLCAVITCGVMANAFMGDILIFLYDLLPDSKNPLVSIRAERDRLIQSLDTLRT